MNFAWRIYRRLAQAFPHEFKLAYGTELMQLGEEVVDEIVRRHGAAGLIRLIADIAIRVPLEYLSEMCGDMRYAFRALLIIVDLKYIRGPSAHFRAFSQNMFASTCGWRIVVLLRCNTVTLR